MSTSALASAALELVGTRFRLHGRNPATGLDCVGLLGAALSAIGRENTLPASYTLRTREPAGLDRIARNCGLELTEYPILSGDVVLVRMGPCQLHLLIALGTGRFVHAHAGARRVVVLDSMLEWPVIRLWRLLPLD